MRSAVLHLALLMGCLIAPQRARACLAAGPPGTVTAIASEAAVIVWDARTHTEHFIRGATFKSSARSFGFLVPTPAPPRLAPVRENVFYQLDRAIQPRTVRHVERGLKLTSLIASLSAGHSDPGAAPTPAGLGVEVISSQQVAGYDAVVLKADDAPALAEWLKSHGYENRPTLAEWLRPYVARHWAITAFKIGKPDARASQIGSPVVRMSFQTHRPFFPYSEPADQRTRTAYLPNRLLRLYVLSNARMDGALDSASVRWPGQVRLAQTPPDLRGATPVRLEAALGLGHAQMPSPLWLTALEDRASPRPGVADLYFTPSPAQTPLAPPPIETFADARIGVPLEPVFLVAGVGLAWGLGIRRRRQEPRIDWEGEG